MVHSIREWFVETFYERYKNYWLPKQKPNRFLLLIIENMIHEVVAIVVNQEFYFQTKRNHIDPVLNSHHCTIFDYTNH